MVLTEITLKRVDWIHLTQVVDLCSAFVNVVMSPHITRKVAGRHLAFH